MSLFGNHRSGPSLTPLVPVSFSVFHTFFFTGYNFFSLCFSASNSFFSFSAIFSTTNPAFSSRFLFRLQLFELPTCISELLTCFFLTHIPSLPSLRPPLTLPLPLPHLRPFNIYNMPFIASLPSSPPTPLLPSSPPPPSLLSSLPPFRQHLSGCFVC